MRPKCLDHHRVVFSGGVLLPPIFLKLLFTLWLLSSLLATTANSALSSPVQVWRLDGTSGSYLQFQSWKHFFQSKSSTIKSAVTIGDLRRNQDDDQQQPFPEESINRIDQASISFEFRYKLDHSTVSRPFGGLLLYTDDETGIGGKFLEIKLLSDSNLRVRVDDNSLVRTSNIIELYRQEINFTDGHWHQIELIRNFRTSGNKSPGNPPGDHDPDDPNDHHGDDYNQDLPVNYDQQQESITVKVDRSEILDRKIELSTTVPVLQQEACKHKGKAVFVGGIPEEYRYGRSLAHLALPTVAYELHFRGSIRNVRYSYRLLDPDPDPIVHIQQQPINHYGLLNADDDDVDNGTNSNAKQQQRRQDQECDPLLDRCKHGGYCYTTKNGIHCDCSVTDFEGTYCQNEKRLAATTFYGQLGQYLGYNHLDLPNAWSLVSSRESFELSFRTKSSSGLLLLTSDEYEDYLAITIRDAGLTLTMKLGANIHEKTIKPSKVRFDDNQWHSVLVWRRIREISPNTFFCHFSISVDGIYTEYGSTGSTVSYLISRVFYVGGIAHNSAVETSNPIMATGNFAGCLRRIILTADNVRLDLLEILANDLLNNNKDADQRKSRLGVAHDDDLFDGLIRFYGNHTSSSLMQCEDVDVSDPITFTTSESYLKLDGFNSPKEGTISLKIRTNEPNGVLLYADGKPNQNSTTRDYLALELLDGHLYLMINLGFSPIKVKATIKRVDDGHWHTVTLRRSERSGQMMVDEVTTDFITLGQSNRLDLGDAVYLGGLPHHHSHPNKLFIPPELWSAALGYGYIGCVRDLTFNDQVVDIATHAKRQDSGSIRPSCHSLPSQCIQAPCQNGGQCIEGWNRYYCDCSKTAYTGPVCTKNAATVSFNGEQYVMILLPDQVQSQAESISLRFHTSQPDGLLLMTTTTANDNHQDDRYMTISLESGSLRLDFNNGDSIMERLLMGNQLNDDQWHTIHLERRGPNLEIKIDSNQKQVVELTGQYFTLPISAIHLGARLDLKKEKSHNYKKHWYRGFIGQMQNFHFNGQQYFEKIRDGQFPNGSIRITAKLGKKDRILHNAVTFKSKYTFVALSQLKAYSRLNVHFQFKTREPNGLIMFNGGGRRHDFLAVELVNGQLHYMFDLGDGPRRLQSNMRQTLNDNRWHTVTLGRPSLHRHTMLVDESLITTTTSGSNQHLDLDGLLYIGGVRETMWPMLPNAIKSRFGYEGCLASLDLNGETFNLVEREVLIPSTLVESGCSAPITRCSSTACANRGICVQLWNSYTCDCDLTTYSGPTCADGNESTAYQFGPNPGLISFTFDEDNRPDTRNDLLALGFLTNNKNGALVRVDSATTADYFQLELIDGNVLAVYNLGTEDIDIGDLSIKVNDGKYHIVRFTRSGQNSTLQIDNHNVITRSPVGKQLNIFNRHAFIQIGGHKNVLRGVIEKPFIGIIAGLVFNGHRLLDMAAEDDPRIKIEGDVELMISIGGGGSNQPQPSNGLTPPNRMDTVSSSHTDSLENRMLAEPKSSYSGDDLIYSNAGSGCFDVNEDEECAHIANEGSGDDLITPVYVSVNKLRPTPSSNWNRNRPGGGGRGNDGWRRPCQNEDDDDCMEGSGDYPPPSSSSYDRNQEYYGRNRPYNNYSNNHFDYYSSTPRPWMTTWMPPTVAPIMRPPFNQPHPPPPWNSYPNTPPTFYNPNHPYGGGGGQLPPGHQYPMRPKTTAPSWTKPVYSVGGPSRPMINPPVEPQSPPEIYHVPLNIPDVVNLTMGPDINVDDNDDSNNNNNHLNRIPPEILSRTSSDRTVIIISAIAILLILVVVIGPIVLFYKVRYSANQQAYKIETFGPKMSSTMPAHGSMYPGYNPVVRATSVSGITGHHAMMMAPGLSGPGLPGMNSLGRPSISRPGTRPGTPTQEMGGAAVGGSSMKKKDPHEWYV